MSRYPRRMPCGLAPRCLFATLLAASSAHAAPCAIDTPPAATLLLPYFEVDLEHPDGVTTLFSINNASATAVLTNVVLWTDLGIPTLSFRVYLTGYDVQTINLHDVFDGRLPRTASTGQDPTDTVSHKGPYSQDINFASCFGQMPPPPLDAAALAELRAAHGGQPSSVSHDCAGLYFGDRIARGYVTVDTVNNCTLRFPSEPGYFGAGGMGDVTDQNVLWGDFFLVDPANNHAEGENLVRLEATPGAYGPGQLTFYGRFVDYSGVDDREPLATVWSTRFVNGGNFTGGTDVLVWRDPEGPSRRAACSPHDALPRSSQSWWPLPLRNFVIFDEQEHPYIYQGCGGFLCPPEVQPIPFPAVTNRRAVGGATFPVPFDFGWVYFDLGIDHAPPIPTSHSQASMTTLMSASGRYAVGFGATPLDTSCHPGACKPDSADTCTAGD